MSNYFNFCRGQSLILQYANSLFIIVSKCGCQTNIRYMNINIMKSLTVHGTGFKLLLHVSVLTGSSFRPSPELIVVVT